jgi:hypothetical protein
MNGGPQIGDSVLALNSLNYFQLYFILCKRFNSFPLTAQNSTNCLVLFLVFHDLNIPPTHFNNILVSF